MNKNLGNLEETILLLVAVIHGEAYGFAITEEYHKHMKKRISISAVHTVLKRLENKGLLKSYMGNATKERGGRRKRIFAINKQGLKILREIQLNRIGLWKLMPQPQLQFKGL